MEKHVTITVKTLNKTCAFVEKDLEPLIRTHIQLSDLYTKRGDIYIARALADRSVMNYDDLKKITEHELHFYKAKMEALKRLEIEDYSKAVEEYEGRLKLYDKLIAENIEISFLKTKEEHDITNDINALNAFIKEKQTKVLAQCSTIESQVEMLNKNLGKLVEMPTYPQSAIIQQISVINDVHKSQVQFNQLKKLALDLNVSRYNPSVSQPVQHTQQVKIAPLISKKPSELLPASNIPPNEEIVD